MTKKHLNKSGGKAAKQMTIPIFIPHMGCENACTFCNQRTISGASSDCEWTETQLTEQIESWLESGSGHFPIEIGFFGGSFTGIPAVLQERCLSVAKRYLDAGRIQGIRLSTRPDYLGPAVVERLKAYGVTLVELGVQSFSDKVLKTCQRGHDVQTVEEAIVRLRNAGLAFGIQLMIGLPGDSREGFKTSVSCAIGWKPDCVRLYPTLVLSETQLANELLAGLYQPLSLEEAVDMAAEAYQSFMAAGIPVIRMGLQSSENLSDSSHVLAGPHHDAFRTLVESTLYRRLMERDLENGLPDMRLCVSVHPKHVSFFSGHQSANLKWLRAQGICLGTIHKDDTVQPYEIKWLPNHECKR